MEKLNNLSVEEVNSLIELVVKENSLGDLIDLLSEGVVYESSSGFSLVHLAVLNERIDILCYLHIMGYDINAKDIDGITPLHLSVLSHSNKSFDFLIDLEEIELNSKTNEGNTFLHYAMLVNNMHVAKHKRRSKFHYLYFVKNNEGKCFYDLKPMKEFVLGLYTVECAFMDEMNTFAHPLIKIKYEEKDDELKK